MNMEIANNDGAQSVASLPPRTGSALLWSSDYPKQPGLYWTRWHGCKKEILTLTGDPGNLKQLFYGERIGLHNLPKDWGFQWAGPIPEPKEPNGPSSAMGASKPTEGK